MPLNHRGDPVDPKPSVVEDAAPTVDRRDAADCQRGVEILSAAIERIDAARGHSLTVDARDLERETFVREVEAIAGGEDVETHALTPMQLKIAREYGLEPSVFASMLAARDRR